MTNYSINSNSSHTPKKTCLSTDCPERAGGECCRYPEPAGAPEQILELLKHSAWSMGLQGASSEELDKEPQNQITVKQALAKLDRYYKAQASKDMVEVIGNCSGGHQDWEVEQQCYVENRLRAYQRKTATSKGYKAEEENLNG